MRFTIIDLIILSVFLFLGFLLEEILFNNTEYLWILIGMLAYILIAPFIYKLFHLRSLTVPDCPNCKPTLKKQYTTAANFRWPKEIVLCSNCGTEIELWYSLPKQRDIGSGRIAFVLSWPYSWGRWVLVKMKRSSQKELRSH